MCRSGEKNGTHLWGENSPVNSLEPHKVKIVHFIFLSYLNLFQSVMVQRKNNNKSDISLFELLEHLAFETFSHGTFLGWHTNLGIWKPSFPMVPILPQRQGPDNCLGKIIAFFCSFRMQGAVGFHSISPCFSQCIGSYTLGGIKNCLHL